MLHHFIIGACMLKSSVLSIIVFAQSLKRMIQKNLLKN